MGPIVSHFSGRVVQVFGTSQLPAPSTVPLQVAGFLFLVALALPYIVAFLPVLVLLFVAWLWLRRRGWVRGGLRLPRFANRSASDAGLQVTSFRVRVSRDDEVTQALHEIDCRLVQRADLGPMPLVGGERILGRGRRTAQGVVEVSWLQIDSGDTTLRTTNPKSQLPVLVLAGLVLAGAAAVLYGQRDEIPAVNLEALLGSVVSVLVPLIVIYVIIKKVILRR